MLLHPEEPPGSSFPGFHPEELPAGSRSLGSLGRPFPGRGVAQGTLASPLRG